MSAVKLLASRRLKLQIAAGAIALLVAGAWLAPSRTTTIAPSQERPTPLLEEQVQQREASQPFRGVQDIAAKIGARGVALQLDNTAASINDFVPYRPAAVNGFGVPIGSGFVLTHRRALEGARQARVASADGNSAAAQLAAYDEVTGLALLRANAGTASAAAVATTMPAVGSLAVAAAQWPGHELLLPVFIALVASDHMRIGGDSGMDAAGLPIFDADGKLIAIGIGRGEARPVRAAIDRLLQRAMADSHPRSFGLAFQERTEALQPVFGDSGVIVIDVLPDGPAMRAGIRPGDVITAIGGSTVANGDEFRRVTAGTLPSPVAVTVRRANAPLVVLELTLIDAFDAAALADRRPVEQATPAGAVLTPQQLASLAIPFESRIVSINGQQPVTSTLARRELGRRTPAAILVADGARRYFVLARNPS